METVRFEVAVGNADRNAVGTIVIAKYALLNISRMSK